MSVFLSPVGGAGAQFFDNNGSPLSGGKLYTYAAGTTTPQATYTSSAGATFHSNPIILDAAGRVPGSSEIWLADNQIYKFVLKTSTDVLLATWDQITGVNSNFVNYTTETELQTATDGQTVFILTTMTYSPGTGSLTVYIDGVNQYEGTSYVETDSTTVTFTSGLHVGAEVKFTTAVQTTGNATDASVVTYTAPFTGAVAYTVEDKLSGLVSLADFGADATGAADSATAINAAFNSGAKAIYATGTFKIESNVTLPTGVCFYGWPRAIITTDGGGNFIVTSDSTIENIDFDWNSTARRVYGDNASNITFKNCASFDSTGNGFDLFNGPVDLTFDGCTAYDNGGYGIAALGSTTQRPNRVTIKGCKAYQNFYDGICVAGVGEKTSPAQSPLYAQNIVISDCVSNSNGYGNTAFGGIATPYCQYLTITNCVAYSNTEHGFGQQEMSDFAISNCVSYGNGQAGISFQSGYDPYNPCTRGVVTGFNAYNKIGRAHV